MRALPTLLLLVAAFSVGLARPAQAGLSGRQELMKLAARYAVPIDAVFDPAMKPKTLCYCTAGDRSVGFLGVTLALEFICAVPTSFSAEGEFQVVDYGCTDFEIIGR
jgi:hypothetical protein